MAAQVLETISQDEREQMILEAQLLYEADQKAEIRYALRTGREEGREKGREESTREIAKNFKMKNISLDIIAESTGLSLEVLKTL